MIFIETVPDEDAEGATKTLYDQTKTRFGYLPNMAKAFSKRPKVWEAWGALLKSISSQMDQQRYELVTLAAAQELRSSYCMLAHGSVLLRDSFTADELQSIVNDFQSDKLNSTEKEVMQFARKVVRDASSITKTDVERLKKEGLSDEEVFDVVAAASARCFFSKVVDALGAQPDRAYHHLNEDLKSALTVGRAIE